MYKKIEGSPRMTRNEAMERYPDSYILMQQENDNDFFDPVGVVLYIGDDGDELFSLQVNLPIRRGVVYEGINIQRYSLGGVVVARS